MNTFNAYFAKELPRINGALDAVDLPGPVRPIARHILQAGGKRLRPLLTVLVARLCGYAANDIYRLAVTMEMLHAATLLHDDVLDSATHRRGEPAAHTLFDMSSVILAGDALLAQANAQIAAFGDTRLSLCFSEATSHTAAGEILEIAAKGKAETSAAEYETIVRGKTAWLIRASCELGALRAKADAAHTEAAAGYGENLGMAFQVVDDALDCAPQSVTGKPSGGDVREGKMTLPLRLYRASLDKTEQAVFDKNFTDGLMTEDDVQAIVERLRNAGYDMQARDAANAYLEAAQAALRRLPDKPEREVLSTLCAYVSNREK
ncbi:MAG: polyprenyl synthetase family protein [Desulfovibrio sp.]|jgi:octaprenyl-diphosphate synthase|nr:polyprenyl synthetase family protein [Desulfovibrio sp.]